MTESVTLNTGSRMPVIGLGTYLSGPGPEAQQAVLWALESGYRLIDTSLAYGNESDVGRAIRESGLPREEIFLTTKLENADQGYNSTLAACRQSLRNLRVEYLDLYLVHWPVPTLRGPTWTAMEILHQEGICRAIGVSNYTIRHLRELLQIARVVPAVNQVEFHPFLYQRELQTFCAAHGIAVEAYSPLTKARRLSNAVVHAIASRHARSPAQILLRWQIQHGVSAIPKSVQKSHIEENIRVFDFSLTDEDMQRLDGLNQDLHLDWNPTHVP